MSLSKHLSAYPDIHEALTAALHHKGGRIRLETRGQAFYWKARANQYKSLLHKDQAAQGIHPTATPFDRLVVKISAEDDTCIILAFRAFTANFETLSGEVVPTEDFKPPIPTSMGHLTSRELDDVNFLGGETDDALIDAATAARAAIFGEEG